MSWWLIPKRQKSPGGSEVFEVDWTKYLVDSTIASVTWTVPVGITKVSNSNTTTSAYIKLSGGTVDTEYTISCTIVTSDSPTREPKRSFVVSVQDM